MPRKPAACAQAYGAVRREIRVIWRKPDCLKPSLQKARIRACRKDARNRYRPLPQVAQIPVVILRGAGAMSCQGIKGDGRAA